MKLQDAQRLAEHLMWLHGVAHYKFSFMQRRTRYSRAGQCWYTEKRQEIQLQPTFVEKNQPMIVKQVILHEIAHALRPMHGHNKFFQGTATALGCVKYKGRKNHTYYGKEVKK